jgi:gamma-glutamyl hydrolase
MEGRKYPFYSMQWHPEKSSFEWNPQKAIPHFSASIEISQYISNFFVNEARFASRKEERAALIYNHNPTYIAGINEHG